MSSEAITGDECASRSIRLCLSAQVDDMTEHGDEKDEFAQKMKNFSIVETIGQMKSSAADENVQSAGCQRLCRSKADHDQVEANGGIERALEAMRSFPANSGVQRNGAMQNST